MHFRQRQLGRRPSEAISAALAANSGGLVPAYGNSEIDKRVEARFSEIFGRDVAVFFVGTGTAANALALAQRQQAGRRELLPPRGACASRTNAARRNSSPAASRLHPVDGALWARSIPTGCARRSRSFPPARCITASPWRSRSPRRLKRARSIRLTRSRRSPRSAAERGLPLHMDGARFANALVSLGATPARDDVEARGGHGVLRRHQEWLLVRRGDGGASTLQGQELPFLRKRAAQLFSKSRFIAAQFEAYFADDLWLDAGPARQCHGGEACRSCARLGARCALPGSPQANEVFIDDGAGRRRCICRHRGRFSRHGRCHISGGRIGEREMLARFVTSFATRARGCGCVRRALPLSVS